VLTKAEFGQILVAIETHQFPAKNAEIVLLSFKLGLRI